MTRRVVYGVAVWLTVASTVMTIASIILPKWMTSSATNYSYGLHQRCSTVDGSCTNFPRRLDCEGDKWGFCSIWRTMGFLMSFAVVIELCTLVSLAVIISGGVQRRSIGWKVVCPLLVFGAAIQCVPMVLVAILYNNDDRFSKGWSLDTSFTLCTVSWSMLVLIATGIVGSVLFLPEEGGYELIPNFHYPNSHIEIEEDL